MNDSNGSVFLCRTQYLEREYTALNGLSDKQNTMAGFIITLFD
ncbi:MAG: hypothetical protein QNL62_19870 [Gammaproteobacteria bacterium]|nr:hypothetical protein [Gammaproteobacteria bacterium]